ncbi:FAD binding domain-containing protein [Mycoplasmatota bacterium]|nr:FAD binding domain-containing protein [Mycoplasmatota bacterium]
MNVNEYVVVENIDQAYQLFNQNKKNQIIAGGAWLKLSVKEVNKLISLDDLSLNYIKTNDKSVEIGALTSLREVEMNDVVNEIDHGILSTAISQIMGVSIRNLATIGGSIMGRFSFSDIIPVLLVLDCQLYFHNRGEMTINEFITSKGLDRDILTYIKINKSTGQSYFKKISHTALDFSMLNVAITFDGSFRIAIGSQPGMAMLCEQTMAFLNQQNDISEDVIEQAVSIALTELKLSSNIRASKAYREVLAKTYIKRGLRQVIK